LCCVYYCNHNICNEASGKQIDAETSNPNTKTIHIKKTEKEKDARNKSVTTLQNMQRQQPKTHGINTQVIQVLMRNRCRQRVAIVKNEGSYGHR